MPVAGLTLPYLQAAVKALHVQQIRSPAENACEEACELVAHSGSLVQPLSRQPALT